MKFGNIAAEIPTSLPNELVEVLAEGKGKLRIERIVSRGHATPPDSWYEQTETEWVMLVSGVAVLKFEADDRIVEMTAGDWIGLRGGILCGRLGRRPYLVASHFGSMTPFSTVAAHGRGFGSR